MPEFGVAVPGFFFISFTFAFFTILLTNARREGLFLSLKLLTYDYSGVNMRRIILSMLLSIVTHSILVAALPVSDKRSKHPPFVRHMSLPSGSSGRRRFPGSAGALDQKGWRQLLTILCV